MTYGELQQYYKDVIFHTKDGEQLSITQVKAIGGGIVEFKGGFRITLRRIDTNDMIRAANAVKNHYDKLITEIEKGCKR